MTKKIQTFFLLLLLAIFCTSPTGEAASWGAPDQKAGTGIEKQLAELEFKEAMVKDAIRIIAELTDVNILATAEAGDKVVTFFIRNLTVADSIDSICRVAGLWYRHNKETDVYVIMTTEEYFKDIIVFREEDTKFFTLRYQNVMKVGRLIEAMFGKDRVELDLQDDFEDDLTLPGGTLTDNANNKFRRSGSSRYSNNSRYFGNNRYNRDDNLFGVGEDGTIKQDFGAITAQQIEMLEKANTQENPLLLSEKTLSNVRKRSSVPIFVSVNREHNLLFVRTADEKAMEEIESIVNDSDRPTPQVLLEMKILSITLQDGFQSAFDFSYMGGVTRKGPADGQPPNPYQPTDLTAPEALAGFMGNVGNTGSMIFQVLNDNIRARINVLKTEGRVSVLATPLLLATNNRAAKIFIGERRPILEGYHATGRWNSILVTDVKQTEIGNTLRILPSINSDRTVMMRLLQENSQVIPGGATLPVAGYGDQVIDIVKKSIMEGVVMAKDGLTVVVGGMVTTTRRSKEEKVPLLGDIPLLGTLFTKTDEKEQKEELILLITPHVFTTPEEAEVVTRQRLGDLTTYDDSINIYLDELDDNRLHTDKGRVIMKELAETATPLTQARTGTSEEMYIALIRTAAKEVRLPFEKRTGEKNITPVPLSIGGSLQLFSQATVETVPVAEWTDGIRYVAAFKSRNFSNETVALSADKIQGSWQAVTLERDELAPAGEENDTTYMYLISNKPLSQAIIGRIK